MLQLKVTAYGVDRMHPTKKSCRRTGAISASVRTAMAKGKDAKKEVKKPSTKKGAKKGAK